MVKDVFMAFIVEIDGNAYIYKCPTHQIVDINSVHIFV